MFLILQKYTTDPELTPLLQLQIRAHARLYTSLLKQAQLNNRSVAYDRRMDGDLLY